MALQSFRHKGLRHLYDDDDARGVGPDLAPKLRRVLGALDAATSIEDMSLYPGWRLHPLKGDYAGFWSITLTGNWRLIFEFSDGDAFNIDLVDYH